MSPKKRKQKKRTSPKIGQNKQRTSPTTGKNMQKKGISGRMKLLAVIIVVVGVVVVWQFTLNPYPISATGVFYDNPTVTGGGDRIQLPYSFLKDKKIVFTDIKLSSNMDELQYQGRVIPLSLYRGGEYLPLIALYTPSGKVITGIRTCEPCASFSMHIGEGRYLICDACETKWDIETLTGASGGCQSYPPPELTSSVSDNIEIDLSDLGIS